MVWRPTLSLIGEKNHATSESFQMVILLEELTSDHMSINSDGVYLLDELIFNHLVTISNSIPPRRVKQRPSKSSFYPKVTSLSSHNVRTT